MDKRKILGIGTVVSAFVLSVVALTVAFAAFTSDLEINGSATAKGAQWKVVFTDLGAAKHGNDNGVTSTAVEITAPEIVGDTSIKTYKVELKTPGDYVTYNFKISNTGDFPAKIDTSFKMPTPTCTKVTAGDTNPTGGDTNPTGGDTNPTGGEETNPTPGTEENPTTEVDTDATNVCNNLEYTLKYTSDNSNVKVGDTFAVGDSKEVQLRIYYKKTMDKDHLPKNDVAIGNLDIVIPFIQY